MKIPPDWRQGQTVFNFLEWLAMKKGIPTNQNARMADPFHIQDKYWNKYYEEFLDEMGFKSK